MHVSKGVESGLGLGCVWGGPGGPGCNKILNINPCRIEIFLEKHETVFAFSLIYNGGNGAIS